MIGRKKKQESRAPRLEYNRQQSYHYSAKRSNADKLFDRGKSAIDAAGEVRMRKRAREIPTFISLLLVGMSIGYLCSLSTVPQITVDGSQAMLRDQGAIVPRTHSILSSSMLNRTKLTLQDEKIRTELKQSFPEFESIDISTPIFRHRPQITITLARPALLFSSGGSVYLLDTQGRALFDTSRDKTAIDTSGLPLLQDQSTHKIEIGKTALASTQVSYIEEIRRQSEEKDLKIESIMLTGGGGELDVRYVGLGYFVKFNFYEDARKSTGTFLALKEKLDKDNTKPVEYIDVRIPERAYVK
jgi:hypothetical protein